MSEDPDLVHAHRDRPSNARSSKTIVGALLDLGVGWAATASTPASDRSNSARALEKTAKALENARERAREEEDRTRA